MHVCIQVPRLVDVCLNGTLAYSCLSRNESIFAEVSSYHDNRTISTIIIQVTILYRIVGYCRDFVVPMPGFQA